MSLTGALKSAISGLQIAQIGMDWAAQNVSNVNTAGYTKKVVEQSSTTVGGVRVASIDRSANDSLIRQALNETTTLSKSTVADDFLRRVASLLGETSGGGTINTQLSDLSSALEELAAGPGELYNLVLASDSGQQLSASLRDFSDGIQDLRGTIETELSEAIDTLNKAIRDVAYLNGQISHYGSINQPIGDLKDNRDVALKQIAELMPIRIVDKPNGEVTVFLPSGIALIDGKAREFDDYSPLSQLSAQVEYPQNFDDISFVDTPGADITSYIEGGRIGELLRMRDEVLPNMQTQVDNLAVSLRDQINQVHNRGTPLPAPAELVAANGFTSLAADATSMQFTYAAGHDTMIVVLDEDGNEHSSVALSTLVANGGGTWPTFALDEIGNPASGDFTVAVDADGKLSLSLSAALTNGGYGIALIDTTPSGAGPDAQITLDAAGGPAALTTTVNGFSSLFGFNNFFEAENNGSKLASDSYARTAVIDTTGYTINVQSRDGFVGTAALGASSTLDDIVTALNGIGVEAKIVQSGDKFAIRVGPSDVLKVQIGTAGSPEAFAFHSSEPGAAAALDVSEDIRADPGLIARGRPVLDENGLYALGSSDASVAADMAAAFQATNSYPRSGGLPALNATFHNYTAQIVGEITDLAQNAEGDMKTQELFLSQLNERISTTSGVSIDEELTVMLKLQNAYSAAARVISTINEMFQILEDMAR
ncbi:MAG: flagellar hook-associated protein FlgK [Rhodospirillaceae bacterium]|nr:flagellar hook-associated protein FlgK [Rhodospirillaceae bacterium]